MPEEDAYDAEAIDDNAPYDQEGYEEGYDDTYDFDRPASSFLDGMLFGKVPKKIAYPALAAILVVLMVLISAMTSEGFGFGDGVERVSMKFTPASVSEQEANEIEIEVYTSRKTFSKDFEGDAKVTVSYEGGETVKLDNMKISNGHGRETYIYEDFFMGNGFYKFTVSAGGASDSKEKEIKKAAVEIKPSFYVSFDHSQGGAPIVMDIYFALMAREGSLSTSDVVGTNGNGTITVYYCDPGNSPRIDNADVKAVIEVTTTSDSLIYSIDGDSDELVEGIRDGAYLFRFTNNWIDNENHDGNYTVDMTFENSFGEDPDTEEKEGYPHGDPEGDHKYERLWFNYKGTKEYSDD